MSGEEDSVLTPQVYAGRHRVPAHDTLEYAEGVNISADDIDRLDSLVEAWLPLPDVAEILGISVTKVQRLIEDFHLVEVRRGTPKVRSVPAEFLRDGAVLPHLRGTIMLLHDQHFADHEIIEWLFTDEASLPGRPIDHLRSGQRGEVRRRAQSLGF